MSWLYSQALAAEYLPESCSDGEPSAQSNGNPTQLAYLPPDRMTAFSRPSRSGMTFRPLTADRGEELLMSYLAAFRAKTSASPGGGRELQGNEAVCGGTWKGSFAKFDPSTFLWRTHQCSFLEGLAQYSEPWPQWGLMRDGECWEQRTLAHRINGTGSGSLQKIPTPTASDSKRTPITMNYASKPMRAGTADDLAKWALRDSGLSHGRLEPLMWEWLMGWPLGWTDLKPLEMDKCQPAQQQHGDC